MNERRHQVLAVLRAADDPLSITAVADELRIHPNTARFHLEALVKSGQAEAVRPDRAKPGRPPSMFRLVGGMDPTGPRDYRMLAGILADALARQPRATAIAKAAGRDSGTRIADPVPTRTRREAVGRLTGLLNDLGFAPEEPSSAGRTDRIGLHNCPFLELVETRRDVICPIHLGLMQGALAVWGAPITVDALTPFAEPDLCVAHLAPAGGAS